MNGTRDFALEQELSIEDRTKKRRIVLPGSSMSVASAEGSLWDTAVAILMLRYSMKSENTELSRDQKTRSTQRTRRPRNYSETIKRSSC